LPDSQPALINIKDPEKQELVRQLNFIIKDIYRWVDFMRGIRNNVFDPVTMGDHDHKSSGAGGDYPWADFEAGDVTYLQALRAAILASNLLDKSATETVSGDYTFSGTLNTSALTASRLLALDASKNIIISALVNWVAGGDGITIVDDADGTITVNVNQQTHIADASASHAITDPGDTPASADILRDDLVANAIPDIEAALDALGSKVNSILSALETAGILASS
jgi:hypothetical protein